MSMGGFFKNFLIMKVNLFCLIIEYLSFLFYIFRISSIPINTPVHSAAYGPALGYLEINNINNLFFKWKQIK